MSNQISLVTNQKKGKRYIVYLFNEEIIFKNKLNDLVTKKEGHIVFYGDTEEALDLNPKLEVGSNIEYYYEQNWHDGSVSSLEGYPYIEVQPTKSPRDRYSVYRDKVKLKEVNTKFILDNFIQKIEEDRYKRYDLGVVKNDSKFFSTAEESLKDLFKKGKFTILLIIK